MAPTLKQSYSSVVNLLGNSDRDAEADVALWTLTDNTTQRHSYTGLDIPSHSIAPDEHSAMSSPTPGGARRSSDNQRSDVQESKSLKLLHLSRKPRWWSKFSSWRSTILCGLGTSIFVLCCNIALLGWSYPKIDPASGNALLYKGLCDQMKSIDTWSHFGINALSTLLLGASNAAMQCIVAPSRADIDKAHAQHKRLDVGVNGLQNWLFIGTRRQLIWSLLFVSTVPLHLV